ncbi:hypothetical protein [Parabacteroides gordonii]|uniref:hypothetical protein n=1 Tax=Parabacteroides gordonii TaxID=574930 RepID=UPI00241F116C|nr:hypothetical protein [Parabacteroides gordonii]
MGWIYYNSSISLIFFISVFSFLNCAGKMYFRLIKIEAAMTNMMRSSMIAPSVVVNMGALMIKKIPAMPTGLLQ